MKSHRNFKLWLISRLGILLCFVVLPLMERCNRDEDKKFYEAYDKYRYYSAQVSSNYAKDDFSINDSKTNSDFWYAQMQIEYNKLTNK